MWFLIFDEENIPCAMYEADAADYDRYEVDGKTLIHAELEDLLTPGDCVLVEDQTSSTGYKAVEP